MKCINCDIDIDDSIVNLWCDRCRGKLDRHIEDRIQQFVPPNSLTPDDRLFLAYLAAWITNHGLASDAQEIAKDMRENYKDKEQEK